MRRSARDFCKEILKNQGFQIELADSGERALEIMENQETDIVLTDVRMPGMDGLTALRTLVALNPAIKVIMVTSLGGVGDKYTEAMKMGARAVISISMGKVVPARVTGMSKARRSSLTARISAPATLAPAGTPLAAPLQ